MPAHNHQNMTAMEQFRQQASPEVRLGKDRFTLSNGAAGQKSEVASYTAPQAFELPEAPFRLMLPTHDGFYHDGATTAEQTYSLTADALDTPNSVGIEVYADTTRLTQVDSAPGVGEFTVDYSANSITAEVASNVTLHAFYFPADDAVITVEKVAPGTMGSLSEVVYDDIGADLYSRNQNADPPEFHFNRSPYQGMVPEGWQMKIYVNATYSVAFDDSDTDTSGSKTVAGVSASNTLINFPAQMSKQSLHGLGSEVKKDIANRR